MDFWQLIESGTPFVLIGLGGIGWMIKRVLNDTNDIKVKQAVHEERINKHDEKLDEYGNRISHLEHPNLRPHPRSHTTGHP